MNETISFSPSRIVSSTASVRKKTKTYWPYHAAKNTNSDQNSEYENGSSSVSWIAPPDNTADPGPCFLRLFSTMVQYQYVMALAM
eukprot:CAMPEP_0114486154 /NCGR_PEP_ID=MMETSP0109-20121206/66_1 /TAXON_ID=29199 /ORGANISM="Chlorarachnion reptans, Strain CCCM449" /LENGTH=84 /DNA_ID=CAMNT_0001662303 /DNA_START=915 /DNA_END=1169 /DNA_ORIENTATION=-